MKPPEIALTAALVVVVTLAVSGLFWMLVGVAGAGGLNSCA
jgi:hypothetical protein